MAEVKWTKEQESAIFEKGNNILVAAAAGSGKTAVLVERIINKIVNENVDIDQLLVVTFTNAAASEMRERILDAIYEKIENNPNDVRLQKQITLLNKSSICTIHSFCLDVIRNYFYELDNVSANFRIADTTEIELLKQDVLEDLFEEKYFGKDEEFLNLIDTYTTYRGDEPLQELVLRIYNYIQSAPFPKEWLEEKVEMFNLEEKLNEDYSKTIWGKILLSEYKNKIIENRLKLEGIKNKLGRFTELEKFYNAISTDIEKIIEIEEILNQNPENLWDIVYIKSNELKFDIWPRDSKATMDLKNEAKDIRDMVKKDLDTIRKKIFIYDSEQACKDIFSMYKNLVKLKNIVIEFEERFSQKKREKNIIDFHDIEHFALQILVKKNEEGIYVPTEVANKLKDKFVEIAIDEYQDSNLVQEYILNSISDGNNIFMVGDVKQSIYRFRQARPELFLEKYENYEIAGENKNYDIGEKIQLFKNFRSRKNILDITNLIFDSIMSKELGDINYTQEEYLNLGANYEEPPKNSNIAGKAELHIIDIDDIDEENIMEENDETEEVQEPIENTLIEARFVASKINEVIKSDYMIWDKKKGYRKATYKDIVILLRTTSNVAPIYEKELSELNIPVFSDSSAEYLDSIEIQTIMSVLKIINNPLQDIPLITVLRSSIGNFSDNDLVQIRLADRNESFYNALLKARVSVDEQLRKKIDSFITMLEKWKQKEEYSSLDELIWQIYVDSNYYNYVGLLNNGNLRQANLKMLFEKAKQYEEASFKGLYNFINFIDKLKTSSKDMQAAKIIGENDNVVRIMSIHKSKGLEFPIVFLCGTAKNFNIKDLNDNILIHQDLGFGPKYINYERRIEYNTLAKEALKIKLKTEMISEEMRVLYVALTRAREKLYITGVQKNVQKILGEKRNLIDIYNEEKLNVNLIKKYKSYLDWIELVYLNNKEKMNEIIEVFEHKYKHIENRKAEENQEDELLGKLINETQNNKNEEEINKIKEILDWEYEFKLSENIPTKTSVSKIKQEKNKQKGIAGFLKQENEEKETSESLDIPKFAKEEKITGAQKGTLIHLCIKNLNVEKEYDYEDVKELVENLRNKNIITQKEAEAVNINSIFQFTKSNIFKELKSAKQVHKEEPFYISLPAKEIYDKDINENILVQGIIDLYYINKDNKLILVDYKTDYVQDESQLKEKYVEQLNLYKKALEKALNKKVDKIIIYSTCLQKEINMI